MRTLILLAMMTTAAGAGGWIIGRTPRYEYVPAKWSIMDTMMRVDRATGDSWLMTGTVNDLHWTPVDDPAP